MSHIARPHSATSGLPVQAASSTHRHRLGRSHARPPGGVYHLPKPAEEVHRFSVPEAELEFRVLASAHELAAVHRLRSEIQLPGKALADPHFSTREKKETRKGW